MKINKLGICLSILISFSTYSSWGQSEKKGNSNSTLDPGFKVQSTSQPIDSMGQNRSQTKYGDISKSQNKSNSEIQKLSQPEIQILNNSNIDFSQASNDVKIRISDNKKLGKNTFDGIGRIFMIEIKGCNSIESTNSILSFLKAEPRIINTKFLSFEKVEFFCNFSLDSVELKSILSNYSIRFNFISKDYYVIH